MSNSYLALPVGPCNGLVPTCTCLHRDAPCPGLGLPLKGIQAAQLLGRMVGWSLSARPCHGGPQGEYPDAPSSPAHKVTSTLAASWHLVKFFLETIPTPVEDLSLYFQFTASHSLFYEEGHWLWHRPDNLPPLKSLFIRLHGLQVLQTPGMTNTDLLPCVEN